MRLWNVQYLELPPVRQSLIELIRRQQAGRPLEDSDPPPLIERKQGHWPGLPLTHESRNSRRESTTSKKRASVTSQRHKVSAAIVTQKTTLPQLETITHRDHAYQVTSLVVLPTHHSVLSALEIQGTTRWNLSSNRRTVLGDNTWTGSTSILLECLDWEITTTTNILEDANTASDFLQYNDDLLFFYHFVITYSTNSK